MELPVEKSRDAFERALRAGPVVLSAPTGSGKSTLVPIWLQESGRVLVVEPRRIACSALAMRVATLSGGEIGHEVGWSVKNNHRATPQTRILFVTPGVALRMVREQQLQRFATVVIDEFHERTMELDLLVALLTRQTRRLVLMSATVEGDRLARHLGGTHVASEGRLHPVERRYLAGGVAAPDATSLAARVFNAVEAARELPGDILVFLPGKAEIAQSQRELRGLKWEAEVLPLHGGLSLDAQQRVLQSGPRRRVVLSTNVAETSLTVPGIGVVIDSGLVRRTRYRQGRGYLTLLPIAQDSADQRAGRAGRLGPGVAIALWPKPYKMRPHTPPEIHREGLESLLLTALACGEGPDELPFIDPPAAHALTAAQAHLQQIGAVDTDGGITDIGHQMFELPLDPRLARLLVNPSDAAALNQVIDLVAGLSVNGRLFLGHPEDPDDDLRACGCDATALIRAVREGEPGRHQLHTSNLAEARKTATRLRRRLGVRAAPSGKIDRRGLVHHLLTAWPDAAYVARRRRREVRWSAGGTELELGRESAIDENQAKAIVVLDSIARSVSHRRNPVVITAGVPARPEWLVQAGIGAEQMARTQLHKGRLITTFETVHAGMVLASREATPEGHALRAAVVELVLRGRLFKKTGAELTRRLERLALHAGLSGTPAPAPPDRWLEDRLEELGLETADELTLLESSDLLPENLGEWERTQLEKTCPERLDIGDASYKISYRPKERIAVLHQSGPRKDPPPEQFLPRLPGWRIDWEFKNRVRCIRRRR